MRDIDRAVAKLSASPSIGRARGDPRPGIREIVVYPTALFYRVVETSVEIIRVVDGRRDLAAMFADE